MGVISMYCPEDCFFLRGGDRDRLTLGLRPFFGWEWEGLLSLQHMEVIGPIFIINQ